MVRGALNTLSVNGRELEAKSDVTILEAAHEAGIYIPALCYHPAVKPLPRWRPDLACDLCVVEIEGQEELPLSCLTPVVEGMVVHTETPRVRAARRESLRAVLRDHPNACLACERAERCGPSDICIKNVSVRERCVACPKNQRCELQSIARYIGLGDAPLSYNRKGLSKAKAEPLFDRDYNLCVLCGRCVSVCRDVVGVAALDLLPRDGGVSVGPSSGETYSEAGCRFCGACVEVCPTAALMDQGERWTPFPDREAALVPCRHACPAGIDIPRYVCLIAEGRFAEAAAVVRERVPLPGVLGRVCFHPCEEVCRCGELSQPIAICGLKRFAWDHDKELGKRNSGSFMPRGERVAVVGSGPAGLTAAYYLARAGVTVTVFEALPRPGGTVRVGIPEYRLPGEILDREIAEIRDAGITMETNTRIESLDELFGQGYQAIFLAPGAQQEVKLGIPGADSHGVIGCASFLRDVSLGNPARLGDRVAVIGGGNGAIDASRVALRLGAKQVTILYRRGRKEMPASSEDVEEALQEGVNIIFLVAPSRISRGNGALRVECGRMKLGRPDSSGRRHPQPIEGSEFDMYFDSVVVAIGQALLIPEGFGLEREDDGNLRVDAESLATSREGVFAAGDAVSGPASVIQAIAMGRRAAESISRYLGGGGLVEEVLAPTERSGLWLGRDEDFVSRRRVEMPCLPPGQRATGFAEVELGFNSEEAIEEAKRCLRCHLRFEIAAAKLPPLPEAGG